MDRKILIVDDDSFSRKILRNFLAKFPCEIFEAANGVDALALIATESPDMVLLDVNMPVLNGLETLQEIRSSATHSRLPVVAISAYAERSLVAKFIDLGISGFLVKPLRPAATVRRLEAVFYALHREPEQIHPVDGVVKPPLLIVERDPNFREFARPLLEAHFHVVEAATGAVGWHEFIQHEPSVVLIGESLQLLAADRLVHMIRGMAHLGPRIYLLSDTPVNMAEVSQNFDGAIRKSFIPEVFTRELNETLLGENSLSSTIRVLIRSQLRAELITAAQQSIGVLTSQEATLLDESRVEEIPRTVQVRASLVSADGSARVVVGWFTGERDAEQIGSKIRGAPATIGAGAEDAVAELVNTLAGRIRASLSTSGFPLKQWPPEVVDASAGEPDRQWDLAIPFRTADGEHFMIAMWVYDDASALAAA